MQFKIIDQITFIDEGEVRVFHSDYLDECLSAMDKLIDFIIERNNKYYSDIILDQKGDCYRITRADNNAFIFETSDPRRFLNKIISYRDYN